LPAAVVSPNCGGSPVLAWLSSENSVLSPIGAASSLVKYQPARKIVQVDHLSQFFVRQKITIARVAQAKLQPGMHEIRDRGNSMHKSGVKRINSGDT